MAKFSAAIIALFCIFTLSLARSTPENDDATTSITPVSSETDDQSNSASVPLTKFTFRPVNRRFPVRSKHPCRHHLKFYPKMTKSKEVTYGNDMIVSSGENSDFDFPMRHGGGRWVRLRHHNHPHHHREEDSEIDDDRKKKTVFKRYDFDRLDKEKLLKVLKKMRKHYGEEREKNEKGGPMKRVRDFVDHYFPNIFA